MSSSTVAPPGNQDVMRGHDLAAHDHQCMGNVECQGSESTYVAQAGILEGEVTCTGFGSRVSSCTGRTYVAEPKIFLSTARESIPPHAKAARTGGFQATDSLGTVTATAFSASAVVTLPMPDTPCEQQFLALNSKSSALQRLSGGATAVAAGHPACVLLTRNGCRMPQLGSQNSLQGELANALGVGRLSSYEPCKDEGRRCLRPHGHKPFSTMNDNTLCFSKVHSRVGAGAIADK